MSSNKTAVKYFQFPARFDAQLLQRDLAAIESRDWTPHFNEQYHDGGWSGVSLRSVGGKADALYPDPAADGDYLDTAMLARAPYISEVLDSINCPKEQVRLLRLAAGSKIKEHKDYFIGIDEGYVRLHIPLITNPLVEFYLDGERIVMNEGELWYLDFGLKHSVFNGGAEDRVHLVVDCRVNEWLMKMIGPR